MEKTVFFFNYYMSTNVGSTLTLMQTKSTFALFFLSALKFPESQTEGASKGALFTSLLTDVNKGPMFDFNNVHTW